MVLGLRHGRGSEGEKSLTEYTYEKSKELMQQFENRHGSCICRQLLQGCDLTTEEGKRQFKDKDMKKLCEDYVRSVAEILRV